MRLSRGAVAAMAATVALAGAASAAYQVAGHRSAAARVPAPVPGPPAAALRLGLAPDVVTYGGTVAVRGTLADAVGLPLAGRTIEVLAARADAPTASVVVAAPVSDPDGRVVASFRPAAGSSVWLRWAGDPAAGPALAVPVPVRVAPAVTVRARTVPTRRGWTTTFRGAVAPVPRPGDGRSVRLDRHDARGWHAVAVGTLTARGGYAFTVRHTRPVTSAYRVVRPAAGAFGTGRAGYTLRIARPRAPALPARVSGGGPGRLLVTGDSLAYYLGQQLATARGARPTTVESRPSTGLARPDYFDWVAQARTQVGDAPDGAPGGGAGVAPGGAPSGVVVFLGANDCQPLRKGGTGAWTPVGAASWVAEYRRRARELMGVYAGGRRHVTWVGLPIPRKPDISACYRQLNAATAGAARDLGAAAVTWVDSWSVYAVAGHYADQVHGVLARQDDGIHVTFAGMRFLTRKVLAVLRP
jgi:lysophospholipase L1-like esterase